MELILKSVKVLDNREPGWEFDGEMRLDVRFWRVKKQDDCPRWTSRPQCIEELGASTFNFSAGSGETFTFNRTLPDGELGFPLFVDDVYGWDFYMVDKDVSRDDRMGLLSGELSRANGWGPPGEYDERGWVECDDPGVFGFCGPGRPLVDSPFNPPDEKPAYFRVQYELRSVPTPDLTARSFRYDPQRDALCMGIANVGTKPSGPFDVAVTAEPGGMLLSKSQMFKFDQGLDPNESMEPCIAPQMPAGEHAISFTIDPLRKIDELNEGDNTYRSKFTFVPAGGTGAVVIGQSNGPSEPDDADLTVSSIAIKGDGPGGGRGCDAGRNDISAIVKNAGGSAAVGFAVRLEVDDEDDEAQEKSVPSLDPGKELDVRFEDVRLKQGQRRLTATVDAKKVIAESNESNNELKLTVNCRNN